MRLDHLLSKENPRESSTRGRNLVLFSFLFRLETKNAKQRFAFHDNSIEPRNKKEVKKKNKKEKVQRAWEGCLGTHSRRKTSPAAKDLGEPQAGFDPGVSEWGNPAGGIPSHLEGGEPGEVKHLSSRRKRNRRDTLSSGERKGQSLNLARAKSADVAPEGSRDRQEEAAATSRSHKGES